MAKMSKHERAYRAAYDLSDDDPIDEDDLITWSPERDAMERIPGDFGDDY